MVTALDPRRWYALVLLCTASFMVILDSQIVILALPSIEEDLDFGAGDSGWVLSAYLIAFGGLLLLGGRSGDLLGQRRMFALGLWLFLAASLACGLAQSSELLIVSRVVQGMSAAVMAPTALALVMATFPEGPERNKALGVWSATGGMGATAALLIGGPLTDGPGWRWVFFINVPVALVILLLAPSLLVETRDRTRTRAFDPAGALTVTAAFALLVYGVVEAPDTGWTDARTVGLLIASGCAMAVFAAIESRHRAPLVPLRILRSRSLVGGNLVMLALGMAVFGMSMTVSLYAQQVLGYSALTFGAGTAVMTGMAVVGSMAGQAAVTRVGPMPVAVVGLGLVGIGCLVLSRISADGTYLDDIFLGLLIFGPGLGATFVASSVAALTFIRESESGIASGFTTAAFQIGGALGVAILTTVAVSNADGADPRTALTEGYQAAIVGAAVFAAVGILAALGLLRRPRGVGPNGTFGPPERANVPFAPQRG